MESKALSFHAGYVNDVADTHRTVAACRRKTNDYTQRVKGKVSYAILLMSTSHIWLVDVVNTVNKKNTLVVFSNSLE